MNFTYLCGSFCLMHINGNRESREAVKKARAFTLVEMLETLVLASILIMLCYSMVTRH